MSSSYFLHAPDFESLPEKFTGASLCFFVEVLLARIVANFRSKDRLKLEPFGAGFASPEEGRGLLEVRFRDCSRVGSLGLSFLRRVLLRLPFEPFLIWNESKSALLCMDGGARFTLEGCAGGAFLRLLETSSAFSATMEDSLRSLSLRSRLADMMDTFRMVLSFSLGCFFSVDCKRSLAPLISFNTLAECVCTPSLSADDFFRGGCLLFLSERLFASSRSMTVRFFPYRLNSSMFSLTLPSS
mmetsp:Transcript_20145/g.37448  ORF Transcript_20145/g.37448 Transcript_20145/m.37448 type:complete len:242 (-) Transcript_20145:921-1646(-)